MKVSTGVLFAANQKKIQADFRERFPQTKISYLANAMKAMEPKVRLIIDKCVRDYADKMLANVAKEA